MLNTLTNEDKQLIRDYIEEYAGYGGEPSSSSMTCDVDYLLRFWERNKEDLFEAFGRQFILTRSFTFSKKEGWINDIIDEKLLNSGAKGHTFYQSFSSWRSREFGGYWRLGYNTPEHNRMYAIYQGLDELLTYDCLAENIYNGETFEIPNPNSKHPIVVSNGCKVSRVLGKIAAAYNLTGYEDFRLAHSMCLNTKSVSGEVCLSIHPLDYMTMSDNGYNWDSCMNWQGNGEYRQGTVEMMNSPYIVVAYLKGKEKWYPLYNDDRVWNNKRWRTLFIVHNKMIMGIRQYPYDSDELNKFCLNWLREIVEPTGKYGPYTNDFEIIQNHHTNKFNTTEKTCHICLYTDIMYNDCHSEHSAYIIENMPDALDIHYSGESECMVCGKAFNSEDNYLPSSSLTCVDHSDLPRCSCCNTVIYNEEEDGYWLNNNLLCSNCYDNGTEQCDLCGDHVLSDNMNEYCVAYKNTLYSNHVRVCNYCSTYEVPRKFGKVYYDDKIDKSYVKVENFLPNGYSYFDIDPTEIEEEFTNFWWCAIATLTESDEE